MKENLRQDLANWFEEHKEDFGVHKKNIEQALKEINNAMCMVGE